MKEYWGVEVYFHSFFDLGTRWRRVVRFTPRPLYPQGKTPWYPVDKRLGGPQIRSGRGGEEKNSQPVAQRYNDWAIAAFTRPVRHVT
jgi:hypothetical protein